MIRKLLRRLTMRLVGAPGAGVASSTSGSNWWKSGSPFLDIRLVMVRPEISVWPSVFVLDW